MAGLMCLFEELHLVHLVWDTDNLCWAIAGQDTYEVVQSIAELGETDKSQE